MESDEVGYGKVYYLCSVNEAILHVSNPSTYAQVPAASSGQQNMISTCSVPGVEKTHLAFQRTSSLPHFRT